MVVVAVAVVVVALVIAAVVVVAVVVVAVDGEGEGVPFGGVEGPLRPALATHHGSNLREGG